jgi:hypothetical protein
MLAKKNYAALEVENRERYRPSQCTNHKGTKKLLQGLERIGKGKARNSALARDGDFGDEGNDIEEVRDVPDTGGGLSQEDLWGYTDEEYMPRYTTFSSSGEEDGEEVGEGYGEERDDDSGEDDNGDDGEERDDDSGEDDNGDDDNDDDGEEGDQDDGQGGGGD